MTRQVVCLVSNKSRKSPHLPCLKQRLPLTQTQTLYVLEYTVPLEEINFYFQGSHNQNVLFPLSFLGKTRSSGQ